MGLFTALIQSEHSDFVVLRLRLAVRIFGVSLYDSLECLLLTKNKKNFSAVSEIL